MLYLCTGTPGAGKTLNTIKYVAEESKFKGRDVYYFGIPELDPSFGWSELTEEEALKWYELPPNSVIIFDEAYNVFPVGHSTKIPDEHVKQLAVHRHRGYDIFLVTQKVQGQVHSFVRGLVGTHFHFARIFNSSTINRFEWTCVQDNPNSAATRKNANVKPMRFDKNYFDKYHSADAHTHKMSLPMGKIWLAVTCLVLAVLVGYSLVSRISARTDSPAPQSSSIPSYQSPSSGRSLPEKLSFAERFKPEIPGIPWSAPAYSELTQPQTWPRPAACIFHHKIDMCACYTQQGTPLTVDQEFCRSVVKNGFFDFTKPDKKEEEGGLNGEAHARQFQPSTSSEPVRQAVLLHENQPVRTLSPDTPDPLVKRSSVYDHF